ncbi:MAG: hypothetical protein JWP32_2900 [Schumannella sp.]|nr:hypothetical protein [Schumannella sp.]
MGISLVAVGAKITAAIVNSIVNALNANGQSLVVPTSVAGTGVSVTTLGKVAFSGAASVSVNGCFSGAFDNYAIVIDIPSQSVAALVSMRFRTAGTDDPSATYTRQVFNSSGASNTASTTVNDVLTYVSAATPLSCSVRAEIFNPAIATSTRIISNSYGVNGSTAALSQVGTSTSNTSVYDGFTIAPVSGTISGTLRVYGYNNG